MECVIGNFWVCPVCDQDEDAFEDVHTDEWNVITKPLGFPQNCSECGYANCQCQFDIVIYP